MSVLDMLGTGPVAYKGPQSQKLALKSMTGTESLGKLSEFTLELLSDTTDLDPYDLLGKPGSVKLEVDEARWRYFNGIITSFGLVGSHKSFLLYRAVIRPALWSLTRRANCRIFQHQSVKEILETMFGEYGFDVDSSLIKAKPPREFLVQYRETDFNFVSRLMENDGIYYYFKDDDGKHQLVLCETLAAHEPFEGYASIPYFPPDANRKANREHVDSWRFTMGVEPGAYATTDYEFKKPADLPAQLAAPLEHEMSKGEIFDYPGGYYDAHVGSDYATLRLEQLQSPHHSIEGQSDARGLHVGRTFKLAEFPRDDQNAEYLVTSARYQLHAHNLETGASSNEERFRCTFNAHRTKGQDNRPQPYRALPTTPKPIVRGPQTAVVAGKDGEDIWTDEYGRIKVQFRWERDQREGQDASVFIRVGQPWAGNHFGAIFIPRVGDEVIVEFLEGDPDRPIVTGSVYNQANLPPYALPANQTQTGIKTRSSKGGGANNFNELRFEDKKGSELLFMQAEKDLTVNVKAAESVTIGATDSITVGDSQTLKVGTKQDITIGTDQTLTIGANQTRTVGADRTTTIGASDTETVGAARTTTIAAGETVTVGASRHTTVTVADTLIAVATHSVTTASQEVTAGARKKTVATSESTTVGGSRSASVGSEEIKVRGKRSVTVGADDTLEVSKNLGLAGGDKVLVASGDATVTLKKNGDILIKGKDITIEGSGKIHIKGSPEITMKGGTIALN